MVASRSTVWHVAGDDAPRQPFGDGRLADPGIADIERVVLGAAAQHLDGPRDLGLAADQRVDPAGTRLGVEIDAVGVERVRLGRHGRFDLDPPFVTDRLVPSPVALASARVERVESAGFLGAQKVDRAAFLFRQDGGEDVPAGDLRAAGLFGVTDRRPEHPREFDRRQRATRMIEGVGIAVALDMRQEGPAEIVDVDVAVAEDLDGIPVFGQRQ